MCPDINAALVSYTLAQDFAKSDRNRDAIEAYTAALDKDANHVQSLCGRGLAFQRTGQHDEAIADFDEVIERHSRWPGVFVAYYSRALSKSALGRYTEAIDDCTEAICRDPKFADAFYLRGTSHKALQQFSAALYDMDAVLALDPRHSEAYRERGALHYLQHHWQQAAEDFTAAIRLNATDEVGTLYLRGMAAQELGEHRTAIEDFTRVIDLNASNGGAYLRRSCSYSALGERSLADADFATGSRLLHAQDG